MKSNRNIKPNLNGSALEKAPTPPSHNGANGHNGNGTPPAPVATPKKILTNGSSQTASAPHADADADPGAFINSRMDYWVVKKERPELKPDRDIVLSAAWNGSGEAVVRDHHVAKFNSLWADAEGVLREVVRDMAANVQSGEAHVRELTLRLKLTDRYFEVKRESHPWTIWEMAQFVGIILFSLLLLGVDVNSAAVTLLESGIEAFRNHYWRAALFNLSVIMGGAFLVKQWQTGLKQTLLAGAMRSLCLSSLAFSLWRPSQSLHRRIRV